MFRLHSRPPRILIAAFLTLSSVYLTPLFGQSITIAVTKSSPNYINWLKKGDPAVRTLSLYELGIDSALNILAGCSGLLVTGGGDVHPSLYGMEKDTGRCLEISLYRDSLELALIREALNRKMPVLGICRGEQIINVILGGTLYTDLPSDIGKEVVHQCDDYLSCRHKVTIARNSLLHKIVATDSGIVTTNHHQAVQRPAPGLVTNSYSTDGVAEGIEWASPEGKSFLLGLQWHPERMDPSDPLSGKVLVEFLRRSAIFSVLKGKPGSDHFK